VSVVSAVQGMCRHFNGSMPLKMKESENHIFCAPYSEDSGMELFRASLSDFVGGYSGLLLWDGIQVMFAGSGYRHVNKIPGFNVMMV